jgi:hypothetical protein
VKAPGAGIAVSFAEAETIWAESSRKHELADVAEMAAAAVVPS